MPRKVKLSSRPMFLAMRYFDTAPSSIEHTSYILLLLAFALVKFLEISFIPTYIPIYPFISSVCFSKRKRCLFPDLRWHFPLECFRLSLVFSSTRLIKHSWGHRDYYSRGDFTLFFTSPEFMWLHVGLQVHWFSSHWILLSFSFRRRRLCYKTQIRQSINPTKFSCQTSKNSQCDSLRFQNTLKQNLFSISSMNSLLPKFYLKTSYCTAYAHISDYLAMLMGVCCSPKNKDWYWRRAFQQICALAGQSFQCMAHARARRFVDKHAQDPIRIHLQHIWVDEWTYPHLPNRQPSFW